MLLGLTSGISGSREQKPGISSPCFNHWELSLLLSLKLPGWSGCVAKLQRKISVQLSFCHIPDVLNCLSPGVSVSTL